MKLMKVMKTMKTMKTIIRTYSELITLPTFMERYKYLRIGGTVGADTFGFDRYLNQAFYKSEEWKSIRRHVIIRDCGCDLGIEGREIHERILIHHINPISEEDILDRSDLLLNPEYLISTSHRTHNAIHYGDDSILIDMPLERRKNDTCPWKH